MPPSTKKLGFRPIEDGETDDDIQMIQRREIEAGLPITERVVMILEFER